MQWEQVRLFLAVSREKSLAAASERLGWDVSTVSRRLDKLEEDVGAPLFDRTLRGTAPTSLAEQMMPFAEEMELAASRFESASAAAETEIVGTVRLTVIPGLADVFVAPALAELRRRHPRLVVELDASIGYADLTRREADIAIRSQRPHSTMGSGDLVSVHLLTTKMAPMTSPDYARELGKLKKLEDARWIFWGRELSHLPDAAWLRAHAPSIEPVFRTSHFASQLAAARAGLGVIVAAEPFSVMGIVPVEHSRALADAWRTLPSGDLWLVGHRALRNVPRVAAVWDFVREVIGSYAG